MPHSLTAQQQTIDDYVAGTMGHVVVKARAGTGKTSTAVQIASRCRGHVGFTSFGKDIAAELQTRLNGTATATTLHSLGFSCCKSALDIGAVDADKLQKIVFRMNPVLYKNQIHTAMRLARLCKYTLTPERDLNAVKDLAEYYGVDGLDNPGILKVAGNLVEASVRETATIDYDDMIFLPVRLDLPLTPFDLLIVDEVQDLSRCQQALAKKASAGGRMVPLGDESQSIFGFTGADIDSMPRLAAQLGEESFGCTELPMTVTFRCPASHVELARQIVPDFEAAPGAVEGAIESDLPDEQIMSMAQPGDKILCRTNSPLVRMTYQLVLSGRKAIMKGREIGRGLIGLIRRLRPDTIHDLAKKLSQYHEREEKKLIDRDANEQAFEALEDRVSCLDQLISQVPGLNELETFINQTFNDEDKETAGKIVLSSAHRAKGLEADRVFILRPELLSWTPRKAKPWELQQARNLKYVALTRSKHSMYFGLPGRE